MAKETIEAEVGEPAGTTVPAKDCWDVWQVCIGRWEFIDGHATEEQALAAVENADGPISVVHYTLPAIEI